MNWIPLKEKKPEAKTTVLVSFDNGEVDTIYQWWADGQEPVYQDFYRQDDCGGLMRALAWMPLPKAYQEKGSMTC